MFGINFVESLELSVFDRTELGLPEMGNDTFQVRLIASFRYENGSPVFVQANTNQIHCEHGMDCEAVFDWLKCHHSRGSWNPLAVGGNYQWITTEIPIEEAEILLRMVRQKKRDKWSGEGYSQKQIDSQNWGSGNMVVDW